MQEDNLNYIKEQVSKIIGLDCSIEEKGKYILFTPIQNIKSVKGTFHPKTKRKVSIEIFYHPTSCETLETSSVFKNVYRGFYFLSKNGLILDKTILDLDDTTEEDIMCDLYIVLSMLQLICVRLTVGSIINLDDTNPRRVSERYEDYLNKELVIVTTNLAGTEPSTMRLPIFN